MNKNHNSKKNVFRKSVAEIKKQLENQDNQKTSPKIDPNTKEAVTDNKELVNMMLKSLESLMIKLSEKIEIDLNFLNSLKYRIGNFDLKVKQKKEINEICRQMDNIIINKVNDRITALPGKIQPLLSNPKKRISPTLQRYQINKEVKMWNQNFKSDLFVGKAIPLCLPDNEIWNKDTGKITIDQKKKGDKLILNPLSLQILKSITKTVVVLCIAGPCRTGKSYLASKLINLDYPGKIFSLLFLFILISNSIEREHF